MQHPAGQSGNQSTESWKHSITKVRIYENLRNWHLGNPGPIKLNCGVLEPSLKLRTLSSGLGINLKPRIPKLRVFRMNPKP